MKSASASGLGTVCGGLSVRGDGPVHLARVRSKTSSWAVGGRAATRLGQQARHAVVLRHSDSLDIGRSSKARVSGGSASQSCAVMHPAGKQAPPFCHDSPASQSSRRGSRIEQPTKTTGRVQVQIELLLEERMAR